MNEAEITVAAREIAQLMEEAREKDAEIERLRARIAELEENIRAAGDFVEE